MGNAKLAPAIMLIFNFCITEVSQRRKAAFRVKGACFLGFVTFHRSIARNETDSFAILGQLVFLSLNRVHFLTTIICAKPSKNIVSCPRYEENNKWCVVHFNSSLYCHTSKGNWSNCFLKTLSWSTCMLVRHVIWVPEYSMQARKKRF